MKKITLKQNKLQLTDEITNIIETEIKSIGNGAMTLVPKKYLGRKAYILIAKK